MRKFSVNVSEFSDKAPILPIGVYKGVLAFCSVQGKENKEFIRIEDGYTWVNKQRVATGEKELTGMMMTGAVLTSQEAKEIMLQDEPRVYGNVRLKFDQSTGMLDPIHNVALKQLISLFDIDFNQLQADAEDAIDFDSIEIPEELQGVENIDTLYAAMLFHREVFTRLCLELNGKNVRVSITHRPNSQNKSVMEHCVDTGTPMAPFCGYLIDTDD